jgi:hypothetical protein
VKKERGSTYINFMYNIFPTECRGPSMASYNLYHPNDGSVVSASNIKFWLVSNFGQKVTLHDTIVNNYMLDDPNGVLANC